MGERESVTFSVITATYNAAVVLPRLIASLKAQTDQNFEWIVADGASTDGTLELLEDAGRTLNLRVDSRPDFGIYDALNRAVKIAEGEYYLVVGADDELCPDTVQLYREACQESRADLVTARIVVGGVSTGTRRRKCEWLDGQFTYVSGHAVGLAIRAGLHQHHGYYSRSLPIAADQLFILQVVHGGGRVCECAFVAGTFSSGGASSTDVLGTVTEFARAQVLVGHGVFLQVGLCVFRLVKNSVGKKIHAWRVTHQVCG
ncbi:MAG TPA: glycosyltransferase [Castellaniella sp.]|uniref:glycosyltransferase n=1 Tax=Castellaniella sp. TaxID=1955812 RepID=UPI002F1FB3B9